jgi:hypothetical protein
MGGGGSLFFEKPLLNTIFQASKKFCAASGGAPIEYRICIVYSLQGPTFVVTVLQTSATRDL